jgi:hypothetical protein
MSEAENTEKQIARNEPCPCGSGKKYKRCHGVGAAGIVAAPRAMPAGLPPGANPGMPGGFDPSQMDPAMLAQMSQMLQRLPRGQMQKLQAMMQRAMSGKDVSREAAEFERLLPPDMKEMLAGFQMPGMEAPVAAEAAAPADPDLTVDEARQIVERAVAEGKLTRQQADELLAKK